MKITFKKSEKQLACRMTDAAWSILYKGRDSLAQENETKLGDCFISIENCEKGSIEIKENRQSTGGKIIVKTYGKTKNDRIDISI